MPHYLAMDAKSALRRLYPQFAKELLAPLLELVNEAESTFDGDLEKFHILLAVALRSAEHPELARAVEQVQAGERVALPSLWTNVHSISLSIGVPEETVRRKVGALVRQGWLERRDHSVRYALKGARELGDLRERILHLAVANHRTVSRVLDEGRPAGIA